MKVIRDLIGGKRMIIWILIGWFCLFSFPTFAHGEAQLRDLLTWFVGDKLDYIEGVLWVDGEKFSGSVYGKLYKSGNFVAGVVGQGPYFALNFRPNVEKTAFDTIKIVVSCKCGQQVTFTWTPPPYPKGNTAKKSCLSEAGNATMTVDFVAMPYYVRYLVQDPDGIDRILIDVNGDRYEKEFTCEKSVLLYIEAAHFAPSIARIEIKVYDCTSSSIPDTIFWILPKDPYKIIVSSRRRGGICGGDPPIYKNIMAFPTPERCLGRDLNGDGDTNDTVLRYMDIEIGEVVNTGALVSGLTHSVDIYENIITFVGEGSSIRYYDINTGTFGDTGANGSHPSIYGEIIAFSSGGTIHYYDLRTQTLVNTNLSGRNPAIYNNLIAFESDGTIRYYNLHTETVVDTGIVGNGPALYENLIAFETYENSAEQDLNGDGDTVDRVIRYYDIDTRTLVNTQAIGTLPAIHQNTIAFTTGEGAVDQDLDGDGEIRARVIRYYDTASDRVVSTGQVGTEPDVYEDTISFYTWEHWLARDLNGDGDTNDPFVQYYRIPSAQEATAAGLQEDISSVSAAAAGTTLGFVLFAFLGLILHCRVRK